MTRDMGSVTISEVNVPPRRVAFLRISPDVMLDFFKERLTRTLRTDGIPSDARVVGFFRDATCFTMLIESCTFEEVSPGAPIPEVTGRITSHLHIEEFRQPQSAFPS